MKTLDTRPRYTTGIVATFLEVKPKTLINYENAELIQTKRSRTGRRLFSKKDVFLVMLIRYLVTIKKLRFRSIKIILKLLNEADNRGLYLYDLVISNKTLRKFVDEVKNNL